MEITLSLQVWICEHHMFHSNKMNTATLCFFEKKSEPRPCYVSRHFLFIYVYCFKGLDDYPRFNVRTEFEEHLDLICWIAAASESLHHLIAELHKIERRDNNTVIEPISEQYENLFAHIRNTLMNQIRCMLLCFITFFNTINKTKKKTKTRNMQKLVTYRTLTCL